MENNKIPNWFYDLFYSIASKHNLNKDLFDYHLEVSKNMYFEILKDIDSGNDDIEKIILECYSNHSIGNDFINDEDIISKTYNGTQFLFLGEFYKELYTLIKKDVERNNEPLPEYDYKGNSQKKIAWLSELGILELVLNISKDNETFNWRRAANIIHSFTDINIDTIRKSLMAIYQPNEGNKKNNPFGNTSNKTFVEEMRTKFKLNKER